MILMVRVVPQGPTCAEGQGTSAVTVVAAPRWSAGDSSHDNSGALPRRRYGQIAKMRCRQCMVISETQHYPALAPVPVPVVNWRHT